MTDWSPDIDNLVSAFQKLLGLILRYMSSDSGLSCARCLVNVDLLYWLSWRSLLVSADGVVENDDLGNTLQFVFE